jgi:hypothetical protein
MRRLAVIAVLLAVFASTANAEDFLDDRSSATAVIRSYYNAINSGQYARAFSYRIRFPSDEKSLDELQAEYEAFAKGYEDTESVTLLTGEEFFDGAAGTSTYAVPVAIDAVDTSGRHQQFAGCYTLTQVSPSAQDGVPFQPIYISDAQMKPAKGKLADIIPPSCEF